MLPMQNLLALAFDRFDRRRGASLEDACGPVLEILLNGGQLAQGLGQIILHGRPLALIQVLVVGQYQRTLFAIDHLLDAPAFGPLQSRFGGRLPAGVLVGNAGQVGMLIQLDRADIGQLQSVNQGEVVGGVVAFVENERRFGGAPSGSGALFEPALKPLQNLRKLLGVIAIALIDIVKERQMSVGCAKQRIADLAEVASALLVFAAFGHAALEIKGVNEGVKVGAIVANLRQLDLLALQDRVDELLPYGLGALSFNEIHVIPEMLRSQLCRRSLRPEARQAGPRDPIPHGLLADRLAGTVDRRQADVIADAQPLGALRA